MTNPVLRYCDKCKWPLETWQAGITEHINPADCLPTRAPDEPEPVILGGSEVRIDTEKKECFVRGKAVWITEIEFDILEVLMRNANKPVHVNDIIARVWGMEYLNTNNPDIVKWHIGHLRGKIERVRATPKIIINRRGFGYQYVGEA